MSSELARRVADAILFEGYVLYPYRASAQKNQARWQFGVLAPRDADEPSTSRTECLIEGLSDDGASEVDVVLRFLQVQARSGEPPWDEGIVREVPVRVALTSNSQTETVHPFDIGGGFAVDGESVRQRWPLRGSITVASTPVPGPWGVVRLSVRVTNESTCEPESTHRPQLLRHCLVAAHSLLSVTGGAFVSMLEPPEWAAAAVAGCVNEHTWPVLVGTGRSDVMLSSPIILYDYPEIAPESPGDMCDATEMDEMLVLRTLTLTDAEKAEARATDARSAGIIDQIDSMPPEMLERLHGAIRYLRRVAHQGPTFAAGGPQTIRPVGTEIGVPWWDPGADRSVSPETDRVAVMGGEVGRGSKVRLHPRASGTDAQDMFVTGRLATVQAVISDVDGSVTRPSASTTIRPPIYTRGTGGTSTSYRPKWSQSPRLRRFARRLIRGRAAVSPGRDVIPEQPSEHVARHRAGVDQT